MLNVGKAIAVSRTYGTNLTSDGLMNGSLAGRVSEEPEKQRVVAQPIVVMQLCSPRTGKQRVSCQPVLHIHVATVALCCLRSDPPCFISYEVKVMTLKRCACKCRINAQMVFAERLFGLCPNFNLQVS